MTLPLKQLLSLIDLTRLGDDDNQQHITELCQAATTPLGPVKAICIYPQWLTLAKTHITNPAISLATVVNFPSGNEPINSTAQLIDTCLPLADEIDCVMPYQSFLQGDTIRATNFLNTCRRQMPTQCLKVIIETSAFPSANRIKEAALLAIDCGADFIKTSTGKHPAGGATPMAVDAMIAAIKQRNSNTGIKLSGGISDIDTALRYVGQVTATLGSSYANGDKLRIGASRLLNDILSQTMDAK